MHISPCCKTTGDKECHKKNFHIGREHTLATICKKIWIPACCGLIRKILDDCFYWKKEQIKPHVPLMSNLPQDRLNINEKPFQNTGTDFFGPILVKLSKKTSTNQIYKGKTWMYNFYMHDNTYSSFGNSRWSLKWIVYCHCVILLLVVEM